MKLYAIPGLGTTEKLFVNLQVKNAELVILKWPDPVSGDTMKSYAKRFLPQINLNEPFCLLGVSFGGMLCVELSKLISPKKIFLISTCKQRSELPWYIRLFKFIPLHRWISENQHRKMAYQGRWLIGFGKAYIPEYLGMINSMQKNYFRNCINVIVNWNNNRVPQNAVHIHGNDDKLLLYRNVKADYTIDHGSHAMIIFQADQINHIIEEELESIKLRKVV